MHIHDIGVLGGHIRCPISFDITCGRCLICIAGVNKICFKLESTTPQVQVKPLDEDENAGNLFVGL